MRTPSSQKCRLDLVPPLADRFILGFPIDYGPVLLLMPFRFHLAVDTLPSGVQQAVAPGQSWLYPAFAFVPVWTSPYLPPSPASEAVNPTFGYGAPHLSARGTSTLLNSALLSAHFRMADQPDRTQLHSSGALDERTGPYASNENHAAFDGQKTEANLVFIMSRTLIFPGQTLRMVPR